MDGRWRERNACGRKVHSKVIGAQLEALARGRREGVTEQQIQQPPRSELDPARPSIPGANQSDQRSDIIRLRSD